MLPSIRAPVTDSSNLSIQFAFLRNFLLTTSLRTLYKTQGIPFLLLHDVWGYLSGPITGLNGPRVHAQIWPKTGAEGYHGKRRDRDIEIGQPWPWKCDCSLKDDELAECERTMERYCRDCCHHVSISMTSIEWSSPHR